MSLLLTHAYYLKEDQKEQKVMKPYPPLGILYISAFLKERDLAHQVFDSTFQTFAAQKDFIRQAKPKIIALYTNLMTKVNVVKLMKLLKKEASFGFPKIVLGGPDVSYNCENYLKAGADFLIIGEGEETMCELYTALLAEEDISTIHGLAYLQNGKLKKTAPRTKIKDLAELPLPNREAIDFSLYLDTWKKHHGKSSMTVSTQRGCPYTCKWCSTAVYGQSYRRRPAKAVVAELLQLSEKYNPDAIWFVDDVFTVSHKWVRAFVDEMQKADLKIPFECITRAERLSDEILALLKSVGCFRIWIGAESGSQKIIDAMDRGVDVNVVKEMIQKTNSLKMESGTFIMLGYPGETLEDIDETIRYLKDAQPTHYTITLAYPIKGTSLFNEIEDKIVNQTDWETSTDRDIDFKRTYPKTFYDYAIRKVIHEVESRREKSLIKSIVHKMKSIFADIQMKKYS
ncbi:B12-binding domain-containing radical SAM protein [Marinilongibacter aquaticus]|uniref:B12-binding domain-containing radical SAM protein n=1 Tax=Marinilongibacter aquaticus TaxID=2975157 RepID=UPI0021BDCF5B|nr:radical SAM protein [Marinilongibacter aquaticus]UBM59292.1 B12-binding domain-containing radical SAM protein [Marinilongibacter aquaticus]